MCGSSGGDSVRLTGTGEIQELTSFSGACMYPQYDCRECSASDVRSDVFSVLAPVLTVSRLTAGVCGGLRTSLPCSLGNSEIIIALLEFWAKNSAVFKA